MKPPGRFEARTGNDRRGRVTSREPAPRCRFPKFTATGPIYMFTAWSTARARWCWTPDHQEPVHRLYADLDGDGDLTNDAPLKGIRRGTGFITGASATSRSASRSQPPTTAA
jgi:hypothetical protein